MDTVLGILSESSVRAVVIAAAMACVLRGMRVKAPAFCHRAWTGVLIYMLLFPLVAV